MLFAGTLISGCVTTGTGDPEDCANPKVRSVQRVRGCDAAIASGTLNQQELATIYAMRARSFIVDRDIEQTERNVEKALALNPDNRHARASQAGLLRLKKDFAGAEQIYRALLKDAPEDAWLQAWHARLAERPAFREHVMLPIS